MKEITTVIFFALCFAQLSKAGHIFTSDVDISYQNQNYAKEVSLFFSLESGLGKGQFLRVKFPDTALKISGARLNQLGVTAKELSLTGGALTGGDIFVPIGIDLSPNNWYQITLVLHATEYVNIQTSGYKGVISMETTSGIGSSANRIIYDSNSAAAVYQLAPKPTETLIFNVNFASGSNSTQRALLSTSYDVFFDFKPQVPIKEAHS